MRQYDRKAQLPAVPLWKQTLMTQSLSLCWTPEKENTSPYTKQDGRRFTLIGGYAYSHSQLVMGLLLVRALCLYTVLDRFIASFGGKRR